MVKNTKQKGRNNELKALELLQGTGYEVIIVPRSKPKVKSSNPALTEHDFFGLWDLIAVKHNEIRFVQVKSNRMIYGVALEEYQEWSCPDFCTKEIWIFRDRVKDPIIKVL